MSVREGGDGKAWTSPRGRNAHECPGWHLLIVVVDLLRHAKGSCHPARSALLRRLYNGGKPRLPPLQGALQLPPLGLSFLPFLLFIQASFGLPIMYLRQAPLKDRQFFLLSEGDVLLLLLALFNRREAGGATLQALLQGGGGTTGGVLLGCEGGQGSRLLADGAGRAGVRVSPA